MGLASACRDFPGYLPASNHMMTPPSKSPPPKSFRMTRITVNDSIRMEEAVSILSPTLCCNTLLLSQHFYSRNSSSKSSVLEATEHRYNCLEQHSGCFHDLTQLKLYKNLG